MANHKEWMMVDVNLNEIVVEVSPISTEKERRHIFSQALGAFANLAKVGDWNDEFELRVYLRVTDGR